MYYIIIIKSKIMIHDGMMVHLDTKYSTGRYLSCSSTTIVSLIL